MRFEVGKLEGKARLAEEAVARLNGQVEDARVGRERRETEYK